MSIEVLSPFSGRPVNIRPQDVGKGVKDEEGRLFYVLPRSTGEGYYGAPTKAGGIKDEERDNRYRQRMSGAKQVAAERNSQQIKPRKSKASGLKFLIILVVLAIAAGAAYKMFQSP